MNLAKSLAIAILSVCFAIPAFASEPVKVGFIYVGPVGDHGWTYMHDQGRLMVEAEFGSAVETSYIENVPEGADAERAITQMALSGIDIITFAGLCFCKEIDISISIIDKFFVSSISNFIYLYFLIIFLISTFILFSILFDRILNIIGI